MKSIVFVIKNELFFSVSPFSLNTSYFFVFFIHLLS